MRRPEFMQFSDRTLCVRPGTNRCVLGRWALLLRFDKTHWTPNGPNLTHLSPILGIPTIHANQPLDKSDES